MACLAVLGAAQVPQGACSLFRLLFSSLPPLLRADLTDTLAACLWLGCMASAQLTYIAWPLLPC
jgi:hypothetical protein